MREALRIATRGSKLALYQARLVQQLIEAHGQDCTIMVIHSAGDINQHEPISELNKTGVFTKELDMAVLAGEADIAVHSLKDVPTSLPDALQVAAVLPRDSHYDIALVKDNRLLTDPEKKARVATGSVRRAAQWRAKFPNHDIQPIRGNVDTRINIFLQDDSIDVIILAEAGLQRTGLLPADALRLEWMLPAPAQGVIGITCRKDDTRTCRLCQSINHVFTYMAAHVERDFLHALSGGCNVPVAALVQINNHSLSFQGSLFTPDGSHYATISDIFNLDDWYEAGRQAAHKLLTNETAAYIMSIIRQKKAD